MCDVCVDRIWNAKSDPTLFWKDVTTVYLKGTFICADIVQRACLYMRKVAGAEHTVHIVNSNMIPGLIYEDPFVSTSMTAQSDRIKKYVKTYPESSWTYHLDEGRVVFVPINDLSQDHWCCAVLWKTMTQGYFIRVYNSLTCVSEGDRDIAETCAEVCGCMDEKYESVTWDYWQPHDHLEQKAGHNRCGLHVVSRCYQVCQNQHLTGVMNRSVYTQVVSFLCKGFLDCEMNLCGKDVLPDEKL